MPDITERLAAIRVRVERRDGCAWFSDREYCSWCLPGAVHTVPGADDVGDLPWLLNLVAQQAAMLEWWRPVVEAAKVERAAYLKQVKVQDSDPPDWEAQTLKAMGERQDAQDALWTAVDRLETGEGGR